AQTRGIDLPALDQLPNKTGLDPVVPPAACGVWGRQSGVEQGRNGRVKAGIIGIAGTVVGPAVCQLTFRAGEIFLGLRQIVVHGCHSSPELYQSWCTSATTVEQTSVCWTGESPPPPAPPKCRTTHATNLCPFGPSSAACSTPRLRLPGSQ